MPIGTCPTYCDQSLLRERNVDPHNGEERLVCCDLAQSVHPFDAIVLCGLERADSGLLPCRLVRGCDQRNEGFQLRLERLRVGDLEEEEDLRLLGQTNTASISRRLFSNGGWEEYRMSPWTLDSLKSASAMLRCGWLCIYEVGY
jgi:hypothetical protein